LDSKLYVLNDLKNFGQISRLSDEKLQLLLFGWERHYENLEEFKLDSEKSSDAYIEYLREYSSLRNIDHTGSSKQGKNIDRSKLGFNNQELLKDLRFENIVDDKLVSAALLKGKYLKTIRKIEAILKATQD